MPSVWTSRRAISLHVALAIFVPSCVALTWWQLSRALGGNTLSWVYTFEWPFFAAYALFMWWKLVHDDPAQRLDRRAAVPPPSQEPGSPPTGAPLPPHARATGSPGLDPDGDGEGGGKGHGGREGDDDDELAAYNRYLAELNASGRQKRW